MNAPNAGRASRRMLLQLAALVSLTMASSAVASALGAQPPKGAMMSRGDITAAAAVARGAGHLEEATALERRLAEGDFAVGDRIVIQLQTDTIFRDTLPVREGVVLQVPKLIDIPLRGVLRSELQEQVRSQLARVVRDPRVEAYGLVRAAVLGEVLRPGYYWMTADLLVSDAIMTAGGPTASAQPERSIIRRGGKELLDRDAVRAALARGATLDQLGFRAGDEIVVGRRRDNMSVVQTTSMLLGLGATIYGLTRLGKR